MNSGYVINGGMMMESWKKIHGLTISKVRSTKQKKHISQSIEAKRVEELNDGMSELKVQDAKIKLFEDHLKSVERARNKRSINEKVLLGQLDHILAYMKTELSASTLQMMQESLKEQFERCKGAHEMLIDVLHKEEIEKEIRRVSVIQSKYLEVLKMSMDYIDHKAIQQHGAKLQLEPKKLPKFDGDIRNYPRFKFDFKKYVEPRVVEDCCYVLKSCLTGKLLQDLIRSVDDDIEMMWKRLDERFGRTAKLVDVVLNEVRMSKVIREDDDKELVHFIEKLEVGYRDLKRIKCEEEMSNTTVVALIESKLPKSVRRDWTREINKRDSKISDKNKFVKFLDHLLELKKVIEYDSSDVRNVSQERYSVSVSQQCLIHNGETHATENCSSYLSKSIEERSNLVRERNACWSCLRLGHRMSDCRSKRRCGKDNCLRNHNSSLHGIELMGFSLHSSVTNNVFSHSTCLLQLMLIKTCTPNEKINVMFDGGSTISLITFTTAERLKLRKGRKVNLSVIKIGGDVEEVESYEYNVCLEDLKGITVFLKAHGIQKITDELNAVDIYDATRMFHGIARGDVIRPTTGEVELLIGFEYAAYHPRYCQNGGHLVLMENRFGKCIGRSSDQIE